MGADLCHQEHLFAASVPQRPAQDGLRLAVVILPGVVEESNAGVCRLVDELDRLVQRRYIAKMMTTHPNSGNLHPSASESPIDHIARSPAAAAACSPDSIEEETPSSLPGRRMQLRVSTDKCASSEGWHEQWVKVPPEQESKPCSL